MERIAIFGGTFDPVHNGHIAIAESILAQNLADQIVILPSFTPPHKQNRIITSFEKRFSMLQLAFKNMNNVEISDLEQKLSLEKSYTFEVMKHVEKNYPDAILKIIIGGDSLKNLHSWFKAKELVEKYEIITYPRANEDIDINALKKVFSDDTIKKLQKNIIKAPFFEISSTILKKKLANNENVDIFIKEEILEYIKINNLYKN